MAIEMNGEPLEPWRLDHLPVMKKNGFRCQECHKPFQAELPYECTIDIWSKAIKKLRCPHCDSKKLFMGENRTLAEDRAMRQGLTLGERMQDWRDNGEHGISSKAMFAHLAGQRIAENSPPSDLGDLRRCVVMLDRFPEWKLQAKTMGQFKGWEKLISQWDAIVAEYESSAECTSPTALEIFGEARA